MTFVQWVEYHTRSIIFVALALAVAGAFAVTSLPVGLFPQVAFPRVQVSLDSIGYFNGQTFDNTWMLPAGCMTVERIWERWSQGSPNQNSFVPMTPAPFGLPPVPQGNRMGCWEMRQNAIWMPGAMVPVDLRIRCRITFPDYLNPDTIDFTSTYIPILDCQNAVNAKMVVMYAKRFAPEQYPMAVQEDERFMGKLRLAIVRQQQNTEYQRAPFGEEAVADFSASWMAL